MRSLGPFIALLAALCLTLVLGTSAAAETIAKPTTSIFITDGDTGWSVIGQYGDHVVFRDPLLYLTGFSVRGDHLGYLADLAPLSAPPMKRQRVMRWRNIRGDLLKTISLPPEHSPLTGIVPERDHYFILGDKYFAYFLIEQDRSVYKVAFINLETEQAITVPLDMLPRLVPTFIGWSPGESPSLLVLDGNSGHLLLIDPEAVRTDQSAPPLLLDQRRDFLQKYEGGLAEQWAITSEPDVFWAGLSSTGKLEVLHCFTSTQIPPLDATPLCCAVFPSEAHPRTGHPELFGLFAKSKNQAATLFAVVGLDKPTHVVQFMTGMTKAQPPITQPLPDGAMPGSFSLIVDHLVFYNAKAAAFQQIDGQQVPIALPAEIKPLGPEPPVLIWTTSLQSVP